MHTWSAPASRCSLHSRRDRRLVAPDHEAVDQAVAAAVREIVLREPLAHPVVRVVRQPEVRLQVQPGDLAGLRRIGLQDDSLLAGNEPVRPDPGPRRRSSTPASRGTDGCRPCGGGPARASSDRAPPAPDRTGRAAARRHRVRRGTGPSCRSAFWYVPGSLTWSMNGRWLIPSPHRKRPPWSVVSCACAVAVSSGVCIQTLRMPVAIVAVEVAASRLASGPKTSPPTSGIHSVE